jgi:hypothetical protein
MRETTIDEAHKAETRFSATETERKCCVSEVGDEPPRVAHAPCLGSRRWRHCPSRQPSPLRRSDASPRKEEIHATQPPSASTRGIFERIHLVSPGEWFPRSTSNRVFWCTRQCTHRLHFPLIVTLVHSFHYQLRAQVPFLMRWPPHF